MGDISGHSAQVTAWLSASGVGPQPFPGIGLGHARARFIECLTLHLHEMSESVSHAPAPLAMLTWHIESGGLPHCRSAQPSLCAAMPQLVSLALAAQVQS